MARTYTISGSLVTVAGDPFDEGKDDFLEFDLQAEDEDGNLAPIEDGAVESISATLRSLDTGTVINGRTAQDVKDDNGGTLTAGTFRLDLSGDGDLVAVGSRSMQQRELTILVTHSEGKMIPIVARFELRAFADVG